MAATDHVEIDERVACGYCRSCGQASPAHNRLENRFHSVGVYIQLRDKRFSTVPTGVTTTTIFLPFSKFSNRTFHLSMKPDILKSYQHPEPIAAPAGGTRLPIARGIRGSARAARVKGGAAGARSERTLDAGEHDETIFAAMGRRSVPARFGQLRDQPT